MPKVTHEQLIDLAEGRLATQAADALRQQIAADPALHAELAAVEEVISLMRSDTSVDAPEHVIARAVRLMRRPQAAQEPNLLQRVRALLTSDSRQHPLAAGVRSAQAAPRSLTYRAEAWTVGLQMSPRAGHWQVRGQLLGPELGGSATLEGGHARIDVPINALGAFTLPQVPAGSYTLTIRLDTREILVEALELGA